jgi:hypothetical protein
MIETNDCIPNPTTPEEITELYARLEDSLIKQTEVKLKRNIQIFNSCYVEM